MSFEGYFQLICKKGHYYTAGLYGQEENTLCPICLSIPVWWNIVDETNSSFDNNTGERIDGFVEPRIKSQRICKYCNSILETIYEVPKEGHRIK